MRVVFLGSGSFAIPSLEALLAAGHDVVAVVTQPDREKGRGRAVQPPPVKPAAEALGLRVLQPPKIRAPEAVEALRALAPELSVVVAYGQILPRAVIDAAPRGTVNVHSSLLPRYRGAAPIHWAIVNGDPETGVTTMLIDEGLGGADLRRLEQREAELLRDGLHRRRLDHAPAPLLAIGLRDHGHDLVPALHQRPERGHREGAAAEERDPQAATRPSRPSGPSSAASAS